MSDEAKVETKPFYSNVALGTFRSPNGAWRMVQIPYNPETNEVGPMEKVGEGEDKVIVQERFKIAAIKNNIV